MAANHEVSNAMIGRWYEIAKKEGRVHSDNNDEPNPETRRMSDNIYLGTTDMQDAIKRVKEISHSRRKSVKHNENKSKGAVDRNNPERLREIISIQKRVD